MARWIIDIQKFIGSEYWTNVYNVLAPSAADAAVAGLEIVGYERANHATTVNFDIMRVRPAIAPAGGGLVEALGGTGQSGYNGGAKLPLFNVVRVDFRAASGRPSRKYLRLHFSAAELAGDGQLATAFRNALQTSYATPLAAETYFCDVDGQPFVGAVVYPQCAMRQLRRGSKRKVIAP